MKVFSSWKNFAAMGFPRKIKSGIIVTACNWLTIYIYIYTYQKKKIYIYIYIYIMCSLGQKNGNKITSLTCKIWGGKVGYIIDIPLDFFLDVLTQLAECRVIDMHFS